MDEPLENMGRIHKECAIERKRLCQKMIKNVDLEKLIGYHVKKVFLTEDGRGEHMWVKVKMVEGDSLIGELDNDPMICKNIECGDTVRLQKEDIEEIC
jgi:uncharacterized protein YegJ (DUF2314 family)